MSATEVLVVEDDDGMASLIQDCLEEAGFTVLVSHLSMMPIPCGCATATTENARVDG